MYQGQLCTEKHSEENWTLLEDMEMHEEDSYQSLQ